MFGAQICNKVAKSILALKIVFHVAGVEKSSCDSRAILLARVVSQLGL